MPISSRAKLEAAPLRVVNPYADQLTFPDTCTRHRRDHEHSLTLIDTITLLYQKQRATFEGEVDGQGHAPGERET